MDQFKNKDKFKYYEVHEDHDHILEDYFSLETKVEKKIQNGTLSDFVKGKARVSNAITDPTKHINVTISREYMQCIRWYGKERKTKAQVDQCNQSHIWIRLRQWHQY